MKKIYFVSEKAVSSIADVLWNGGSLHFVCALASRISRLWYLIISPADHLTQTSSIEFNWSGVR